MNLKAYAKVNLFLRIGPKEKSGFHSLQTLFQEVSLFDILSFQKINKGIVLTSNSKTLPLDDRNIIIKALKSLQKKMRVRTGMKVHLNKRIPEGAGLGGGSSDAATALKAGWWLWSRSAKKDIPSFLFPLAARIGADVPFFFKGGCAWAEGKGERLTPVPSPTKKWMVLIYPRVSVSTKNAYALLDKSRQSSPNQGKSVERNSFEPVILPKFKQIRSAHKALSHSGASQVLMSGSGSSVFGLVSNKTHGQRILKKLKKKPWDAWLLHTR